MANSALLQSVEYIDLGHQYFIGQRELVPATRALEIEGFIDGRWYTPAACLRGTYVHEACELDDRGQLDEISLVPALAARVEAFRRAKIALGLTTFDYIERALGDAVLGVGGRLDRLHGNLLIDLKSGDDEPSHAFQTALYALLAEANGLVTSARRLERCCIYLRENGQYRIEWHRDVSDLRLAKSVAEVAVYKVAHGFAPMRRAA